MRFCSSLMVLSLPFLSVSCAISGNQSVRGIVFETSQNSLIMVDEDGDTILFSMIDADKVGADKIAMGDTAEVHFQGHLITGNYKPNVATKVVFNRVKMQSPLIGKWVQPIPGQVGKIQGIMFNNDGTAASINMSTLVYDSWHGGGDTLYLRGKSIGNGLTIVFDNVIIYQMPTPDSLILRYDKDRTEHYSRLE